MAHAPRRRPFWAPPTIDVRPGLVRADARPRRRRVPLLLIAMGIITGVLATTALGQVITRTPPRSPAGAAPGAVPSLAVRVGGPATTVPAQPVELSIPAIGVKTPLSDLGLTADGMVQAPPDYQVAGWYAAGPTPGTAPGPPAVIAGHIDSTTGPAVFYRLRDLHNGDDIAIRGLDAVTRHFTVYRLVEYAKDAFPAARVYAPTEKAEVRLITCSGQFDRSQGSYLGNLVAFAVERRGG
jgi:Sortase domain